MLLLLLLLLLMRTTTIMTLRTVNEEDAGRNITGVEKRKK